jgi:uncharacterized protein (DUF58 family)
MNPCQGPYCDLAQLIDERHSGRQLNLLQRNRALSALSGPNKTNFRGRGIDFEEVRGYQPGDDIRTIDWRVTARTGAAHTKIFREERERPVLVVCDQRNAMFFGSRHCCKSVLACHSAALLAWAALEQGDRIGGLVFNDHDHSQVRPRRSRHSVLAFLNMLENFNRQLPLAAGAAAADAGAEEGGRGQQFTTLLLELRRIARPGTAIFLISDFAGALEKSALEHLYQLSRHTEITAIHCSDPLEQDLPISGRYRVTDGRQNADLFTGDSRLRRSFRERFQNHLAQLHGDYSELGIPVMELTTAQAPLQRLLPYYGDARKRQAAR